MYVILAGEEKGTSYVWARCVAARDFDEATKLRSLLRKDFKVAHIYRRSYIDENGFPPFVIGPTAKPATA